MGSLRVCSGICLLLVGLAVQFPDSAMAESAFPQSLADPFAGHDIVQDPRARFIAGYSPERPLRQGGQIITVGPLSICDYQDLQEAIDNSGDGDEIRIMSGNFVDNYIIGNKDLKLVGGFVDCAAVAPSSRTTLDGGGDGVTLRIAGAGSASGQPNTIELLRLRITNGDAVAWGGGVHIRGDVQVVMSQVRVDQNQTDVDGGGIQIREAPGALLYLLDGSEIDQNLAAGNGGGIACLMDGESERAWIVLDQGSIRENQATHGGGVFADNCLFVSHAGLEFTGILSNEASERGGGVHGTGGSTLGLRGDAPGFLVPGDPDNPAWLSGNVAGSYGGGVYLEGSGTQFLAIDAVFSNNQAGFEGGGLYVTDGAAARIERDEETDCSDSRCSRMRLNSAALAGGAIRVDSSLVEVDKTILSNNSLPEGDIIDGIGAVAMVGGTGPALLAMEGVVIHDNIAGTVLSAAGSNADINVAWSTLADNPARGSIVAASADARIDLLSSIVWQEDSQIPLAQTFGSGDPFVFGDCLVAYDLDSLSNHVISIEADPRFVDPDASDYHLQSDSPAIDFCDDLHAPTLSDIDNQPRGVKYHDGSVSPWFFDAGADELLRDSLFSDRFEQQR